MISVTGGGDVVQGARRQSAHEDRAARSDGRPRQNRRSCVPASSFQPAMVLVIILILELGWSYGLYVHIHVHTGDNNVQVRLIIACDLW